MDELQEDLGFRVKETKSGDLIISHHGKRATILRGSRASEMRSALLDSTLDEQQQLCARLTGNYKRGNERLAKKHSRNR